MKHKTKKAKNTNKFKLTTNKVYGLAIVVLFLVVFVQGVFIANIKQAQDLQATSDMRQMIQSALRSVYDLGQEQVVINYDKNVVTLPTAKIMLPYEAQARAGLSANYQAGFENSADSITFTDSSVMATGNSALSLDTMENLFKGVPVAQACTRQVLVEFNDTETSEFTSGYEKVFSKTLKDGRQVTGFKSTVCTEGADGLAAYVEKMQSY